MSGTAYIHGTTREEQKRLSRMNDLINEGSFREFRPQSGERILDMGSGLGQFARLIARASGRPVVGIEYSADQILQARQLAEQAGEASLVDFRQGDAMNPPLRDEEWGSFDVAHTRYLLEHVPDPESVVKVMLRAVRPGGRIVLEDDDHDVLRLWPEPPGIATLWQAYTRSYDRIGCDPFIGRRLVSLLYNAGAQPRRNTWIFYGACSGHPDFEPLAENIAGVLGGAREAMLKTSGISAADFDSGLAGLHRWKQRPDAAIWFSICWAEAVRPA